MASKIFHSKLMSLQGNLLNYAFMLTSDREKARKLLDHTTSIALDKWTEATDDSHLKSWVFSIMKDVFSDEFAVHQSSSRVTLPRKVYTLTLTSEMAETGNRPQGSFKCADVTRALDNFSDDYGKAAKLYFAGYSIPEIAATLNMAVNVIRARVAYCRNRLRVELSA